MRRLHNASSRKSEPDFVSQQVTEARRYYLNLTPPKNVSLAVVCGGMERTRGDYLVQRNDFPFYCLEFVAEGEGSVRLNGRTYPLSPGMAFAYAPGVKHTIKSDPRKPMKKYYVDFTGREAAGWLARTPLSKWKAVPLSSPQEVADIFSALGREALAGSSDTPELCQTWLRLLLLKMKQRALPSGRAVPRSFSTFEKMRRHVETHWMRLRTVEDIARECHHTPMYVSRLFRKYAHTGAYQFLMHKKMNRAAEMLLDEGLLVKEVAARLEFADAFNFSRAFKRVHGVSPDYFARSQRSRT